MAVATLERPMASIRRVKADRLIRQLMEVRMVAEEVAADPLVCSLLTRVIIRIAIRAGLSLNSLDEHDVSRW